MQDLVERQATDRRGEEHVERFMQALAEARRSAAAARPSAPPRYNEDDDEDSRRLIIDMDA